MWAKLAFRDGFGEAFRTKNYSKLEPFLICFRMILHILFECVFVWVMGQCFDGLLMIC